MTDDIRAQALDMSLDVKAAHERIGQLEKALDKSNRMLFQLRGAYRPRFDDEADFAWCPKCGEEFRDVPNYCPTCGVHFVLDGGGR